MATTVDLRCTNCGAHVEREGSRFCNFCGAKLPTIPVGGGPVTLPSEALAAQFEVLLNHESMPELMAYDPELPSVASRSPASPTAIGIVSAAAFLFVGLSSAVNLGTTNSASAVVVAVICIPASVLIFFLAKNSNMAQRRVDKKPKIHKHAVLVTSARTKVVAGAHASHTTYFVTVQSREGQRAEYKIDEELAPYVSAGDMGVAYIVRGRLISFRRIAV